MARSRAATYDAFRNPEAAASELGPGTVEVLTFDTARAEVEHVADLLRRAHLEDGIGWGEMAVLVRSGRDLDPVAAPRARPRRACRSRWPATRRRWCASRRPPSLLRGLDLLVAVDVPRDRVEELLISPLGGLDATEVGR